MDQKESTTWQSMGFPNNNIYVWFHELVKMLQDGGCSHKKDHSTHGTHLLMMEVNVLWQALHL